MSDYKNNHYVPIWYQKRFIPNNQANDKLYYLNFQPDTFRDSKGNIHTDKDLHYQGFKSCFTEKDLYTTKFGSEESRKIERLFFGDVDNRGRKAVEYFENFSHPSVDNESFNNLLFYMSTQKLRTPKGLAWLSDQVKSTDRNTVLRHMLDLRQLYGSIWAECIWLIADASQSDTKFIISDHPVTLYNRRCGPHSTWCRNFNDPDIRFHGTHTIFPLSLEKVLIFTNLSWVRNPYQNPVKYRPNPRFFHETIFKITEVQTLRHLNEQEVREINFIIKKRAWKYIAAGKEEWLFPDKYVSKSDWNTYGHGYLLMPDPRGVSFGGEVLIGFKDGSATAFDPFGRRPWEKDYNKETNLNSEFEIFNRFNGEFARLFGPFRRGRAFNFGKLDEEKDTDSYHKYHLSLEKSRNK